jgi:hypothetical protein
MNTVAIVLSIVLGFLSLIGTVIMATRKVLDMGLRVQRTVDTPMIEHEILIRDYCQRHNIPISELTTRIKTLLRTA